MVLLDIKNIHCHYGLLKAVGGVSMEICEGSIIGLLGANGSGKSTILKTVSGMLKPTNGEIWFGGQRIDGMSAYKVVRTGIAHVSEGRRLFPLMTVFENIETGSHTRKDKGKVAEDMEMLFEKYPMLAHKKDKLSSTLSGGEQAQLAIVRALMTRPRMLLLDEPFQGLSPLIIEKTKDMFLELHREGLTILLVEHNLHITLGMSQKIYILSRGKTVLEGCHQELSDTEYVKRVYLTE